ncbi:hypothetical protein M8C21_003024 [Ambrosia artemisiifolia]|uniref:non-specific serine/threonine protein kinase n=1 Tax=Ambrosia artemisiifolia TaxID=4212 RepID=A0AAD5BVL3_AMBAR|nr:hypothetical protein M8C21_003024 [Ambrosia artemisiifolia]
MGFFNSMYIKLPKTFVSSFNQNPMNTSTLRCSTPTVTPIIRSYENKPNNKTLQVVLVIGCVIGFIEIVCIVFFWIKTRKSPVTAEQSYSLAVTPFRKFTYKELKNATRNFRDEIGRGGGSVVYKGRLADNRIAAIKKLKSVVNHQNENEFQAEISTIGRLNHMNLIETWGYCAEGRHRLIVYEYMENGSLAEKLREGNLDWATIFDIAKGTAKGLAYLHEECLEWVLHCDVKPHNILLDANYNPKVADFGLSKLLDRDDIKKSRFSTIRGTRGYMAPEWVFKLPITSKVDVFSYGVVVLEMITGRSTGGKKQGDSEDGETEPGVVEWVRDRMRDGDGNGSESWVNDVVKGSIRGKFDETMMENLVRIALQCAEDDMEIRPTMSQVVNMLLHPENDGYAIKKLKSMASHQNEKEFQAERGYCSEGRHKLIVNEYMENGSLAEKLRDANLDWDTVFNIVRGTAKGLAYFTRTVLRMGIAFLTSRNILLDGNYNPKVADFGLSKLLDRDDIKKSRFSTIRGTRVYMAPEWVFKLPITSKVDVFSYGVVVLEMITGRGPGRKKQRADEDGESEPGVVEVRDDDASGSESWIENVVNGSIRNEFDRQMMENLNTVSYSYVIRKYTVQFKHIDERKGKKKNVVAGSSVIIKLFYIYCIYISLLLLSFHIIIFMAATSQLHLHLLLDHNTITFFLFFFFLFFPIHTLTPGSSLSVENTDDVLLSPNRLFTAGFHKVGDNAYCFAIWFANHPSTVVWMANRDEPVNGKHSKLKLQKDGNLVLTDAGRHIIWSTQTKSNSSSLTLQLHNTGNLILHEHETTIWQSFDYPTDTLLPNQPLTKNTQLVSSRSSTNYSSGSYKLFYDLDCILRLHYDSRKTTTIFWPDPGLLPWQVGRYQYLYSQRASLDSEGRFNSTDGLGFLSADFGYGPQRMMKIDMDGNLRVYSLVEHGRTMEWEVQWQAVSHSCRIHGGCGQNSLCTYSKDSDWSYGCEPDFKICRPEDEDFVELPYVEFYGYDIRYHENYSVDACKNDCLHDCACKGFQFGSDNKAGTYYCYIKTFLSNGYQMGFYNSMYIKLPKTFVSSFKQKPMNRSSFHCSGTTFTHITRSYENEPDNKILRFLFVIGCVIGLIEIVCTAFFCIKDRKSQVSTRQSYSPAITSFREFTYSELKKASRNFSDEIGRGGASVVYKGRLADNRIAAIKKLKSMASHQNENEFQAEVSTTARLNHMNLIETWGYCAEGWHRLIVYEYMENGSLAEKLRDANLDWDTVFNIARGTAKGLAYLHEECLEWVLHCDVKPHNILLDGNYNPKVADFGLSKLLDRNDIKKSRFSTIRGTRGYMAPEWVLKLPITSKVDVFSYGVVVLEMITGRGPGRKKQRADEDGESEPGVVEWVRDRVRDGDGSGSESWVEYVINGSIRGEFHRHMMENLVRIALRCAEHDIEIRPTMSQVVNMLLHPENDG